MDMWKSLFILEEPNLYVTIHDNGEGMDEETLQKLKRPDLSEKLKYSLIHRTAQYKHETYTHVW